MRALHATVLLLVGCGASSASTTTTHPDASGREPIVFARHHSVGQHWIDVARHTSDEQRVTRADGAEVENESDTSAIELETRQTVLAIGADGEPTRLRVEVRRFEVQTSDGTPTPALPAVLVIERGEPGVVQGEAGETLDEATVALLREVLPVTHDSHGPGDDVFGSETPRAPGESWALDTTELAQGLTSNEMALSPSDLVGTTTFVERSVQAGVECLVLRATIRATNVRLGGMPDGAQVQRASFEFTAEGALPRDTSLPMLHEVIGSAIEVDVAVAVDGAPIVLEMLGVDREEHTRTLD